MKLIGARLAEPLRLGVHDGVLRMLLSPLLADEYTSERAARTAAEHL